MVHTSNPLPPGVYRIDLFSPTQMQPDVADGLPVFARWRKANAARVRVLEASTMATEPRLSRVSFEVLAPPGAFPFGQLGYPEQSASVGIGMPSFLDIANFLLSGPLGLVEQSFGKATMDFLADVSKPELQALRAALSVTRANIAVIRATLEAVRNGTAPNPAAALAAAKDLAKQSLELILSAAAHIPIDFPRNVVNRVVSDLQGLIKAIEEAPALALKLAGKVARDVLVPLEVANLGAMAFAAAAAYALLAKRTKGTDYVMMAGAAVAVLGGGTLFENLLHPKVT